MYTWYICPANNTSFSISIKRNKFFLFKGFQSKNNVVQNRTVRSGRERYKTVWNGTELHGAVRHNHYIYRFVRHGRCCSACIILYRVLCLASKVSTALLCCATGQGLVHTSIVRQYRCLQYDTVMYQTCTFMFSHRYRE